MLPSRVESFCHRFGLRVPILLAPMSGVPAPELSIAVANAGGLGACGVVVMKPNEIADWCRVFRSGSAGAFQLNTWIPDPPPIRDTDHEARVRSFLAGWGPDVPAAAGDTTPPDFEAQCEAMLEARPALMSSVMGLFPPSVVDALKKNGSAWIATVTTVAEARMAEDAGADAIAAQGVEAGGHRGAFDAAQAERRMVGLVSLIPAVVDAVRVPVVAAGGIADGRGVAAALALGASAVQIGTGFLRTPESGVHPAWAEALGAAAPEDTVLSRAFSGRPGRTLPTPFVRAMMSSGAPAPAPYPVQRGLTAPMRTAGRTDSHVDRVQAWAGQSSALASTDPAAEVVARIWRDAQALLG
jgi:nitronate monooxygenase